MATSRANREIKSNTKLSDHCRLIEFCQNRDFHSLMQLEYGVDNNWTPVISYEITKLNTTVRIEYGIDGTKKIDNLGIPSSAVKNFIELVKNIFYQDLTTNWQQYCENFAGGKEQLIFEPDTLINFDSPKNRPTEVIVEVEQVIETEKPNELEAFLANFELGEIHLESDYFIWRLATVPETSGEYLIKTANFSNKNTQPVNYYHRLKREAQLLKMLSHPGIVKLRDSCVGSTEACLVLENCGDSLRSLVEKRGTLEPAEIVRIGQQLCMVLKYLHEQKTPVLYLNLSPSSVCIDEYGQLKLTDFSEANVLCSPVSTKNSTGSAQRRFVTHMELGSDLYALGKTLATLAPPAPPSAPIPSKKPVWQKIFSRKIVAENRHLTDTGIKELDVLISELISPIPSNRPESAEVVLNRLSQLPGALGGDLDFSPESGPT